MAKEDQDTSNEGWNRFYPEEPIYSRREVRETLRSFLKGAVYQISQLPPIGFVMPDSVASREIKGVRHEMVFVTGAGINDAFRGFRHLAAV